MKLVESAARGHLSAIPALGMCLAFSLGGSENFLSLCLSTFITHITQTCGEEEKRSGMRSVTNSSTFMSLNYLVASEIGTSC